MDRQVTLRDCYKKYYRPEKKPRQKLSYDAFVDICYKFNQLITDKIVYDGLEFQMPYSLGVMKIRRRRKEIKLDSNGFIDKNNLRINWVETWRRWEKKYPDKNRKEILSIMKVIEPNKRGYAFFYNEHTNGWNCRWYWGRSTALKNGMFYILKITKANRHKLAHAVISNPSLIYTYSEFLLYMKYSKKYAGK